ncbi:MAG TPA: hypothetical protein VKX16_03710 [Chloroflexota bacterium]|nr:hypothetical protein [Chloroflexota bacterium]
MSESPAIGATSPELERAEELVDAATQTVVSYALRLGHSLVKAAALAREEADDIWAEAQELSRRPSP